MSAADLVNHDGLDADAIGTITGSPFPVSLRTIERFIDAGGYGVVTTDENGAVTAISSPRRCFAPGCTSPHCTLQAHRGIPDRDGGPTALENGILLCFWHHQIVDTCPWEYRMIAGLPHVRGPGILDWTCTRTRTRVARVA